MRMNAENSYITLETTLDPEDGGKKFIRSVRMILHPEHGSRRFFLNVDNYVTEYTASYPRRH
jgi:hypothetical protein